MLNNRGPQPENSRKVFITGGTGFLGKSLASRLTAQGHQVTILTRRIKDNDQPLQKNVYLEGDPTLSGSWQDAVKEHDVIINLAGASIFSRWTEERKKQIRDSRILTTQHLVEALEPRKAKETLLINASAVGYYGFQGDDLLDENSPSGSDYLASVTVDWEKAARAAEQFGVRVVICRFGIILGEEGGALKKLTKIVKLGLGAPLGSGKQWFSWIHRSDLIDVILYILSFHEIRGPVNCTSPQPVTNRELMKGLGKALKRPVFLPPIPGFLLKLVLGEFGNTLLKGQRVYPAKLTSSGFAFKYPTLESALSS
ncbi:MAG: TIGR01777 family oxidoreductase [Candidatus Aminicenantes bacterium]|nr:TIGR01777 family oxidoreductase [Candidatus Aminicenantes bacterium]